MKKWQDLARGICSDSIFAVPNSIPVLEKENIHHTQIPHCGVKGMGLPRVLPLKLGSGRPRTLYPLWFFTDVRARGFLPTLKATNYQ